MIEKSESSGRSRCGNSSSVEPKLLIGNLEECLKYEPPDGLQAGSFQLCLLNNRKRAHTKLDGIGVTLKKTD